jgi:hypothetical protein
VAPPTPAAGKSEAPVQKAPVSKSALLQAIKAWQVDMAIVQLDVAMDQFLAELVRRDPTYNCRDQSLAYLARVVEFKKSRGASIRGTEMSRDNFHNTLGTITQCLHRPSAAHYFVILLSIHPSPLILRKHDRVMFPH